MLLSVVQNHTNSTEDSETAFSRSSDHYLSDNSFPSPVANLFLKRSRIGFNVEYGYTRSIAFFFSPSPTSNHKALRDHFRLRSEQTVS